MVSQAGCESDKSDGLAGVPVALSDLAMTDQDGRAVSAGALLGQLLVLNFMFTSCPGPCPRITKLLVETRQLLPEDARMRIRFVSVTVDPENDSSGVLKSFARRYSADVPEWSFVRTSRSDLETLAERMTVFDPAGPKAPPAHSTRIYLFDRGGRALQRYDGNVTDARHLARELIAAERLDREH